MALFLLLLAKTTPAHLPTALSVALRPRFPFQQAQFVQVFPLKPTPFYTLFAGLGSTNKSATFLLFFFYLILVLSSPLCPLLHLSFYLNFCGRSGRNCLLSPPVLLNYNWSPDIRFSRGTTQLSRRGALLALFAILCSTYLSYPLSSFLGLEAYCLIEVL